MELKTIQGRKHKDDKLILVKTEGWEALNFIDILEIMTTHIKNEDNIYANGQGGGMLISALYSKLNGKSNEDLKRIYKL